MGFESWQTDCSPSASYSPLGAWCGEKEGGGQDDMQGRFKKNIAVFSVMELGIQTNSTMSLYENQPKV